MAVMFHTSKTALMFKISLKAHLKHLSCSWAFSRVKPIQLAIRTIYSFLSNSLALSVPPAISPCVSAWLSRSPLTLALSTFTLHCYLSDLVCVELISPIYLISSNNSFLKELTVNIQHGAVITSEEQCAEFKFIVAECSQEVLPYKFKKTGKGLFNTHSQYAAIQVKQFSYFGLTGPVYTKLHYMSLKFYKPIATNKVDYVFCCCWWTPCTGKCSCIQH